MKTVLPKEKLLIMSNLSFCHTVFKRCLLHMPQKCVYKWERVKVLLGFYAIFSSTSVISGLINTYSLWHTLALLYNTVLVPIQGQKRCLAHEHSFMTGMCKEDWTRDTSSQIPEADHLAKNNFFAACKYNPLLCGLTSHMAVPCASLKA